MREHTFRAVGKTEVSNYTKSLAQCLDFYPMTLKLFLQKRASSTVYRDPIELLQTQQPVIGMMFGFLSIYF